MKTTILDVGGMLSVLDSQGVEKQLRKISGVSAVGVNIAANNAVIEYDEKITNVDALRTKINECGFHCSGEVLPDHICKMPSPAPRVLAHVGHEWGRAAPTEAPMPRPASPHAAPVPAAPAMVHDMAHETGHGAGMDMQGMARDMRNRFWISLIFTVPIFIYSPMGNMFTPPVPPFGLDLNIWLFVFASAAILYPAWPFFVDAIRALRNGILNMAVLVLLSVGTGYLFSVGSTFFFTGQQFYEASAVLLVFILLGHWLEMRARAERPKRSGRCLIWRRQWRPCFAMAGKLRSQQPRSSSATPS